MAGGRVAHEALASQDFGEMADCLDADVWLRALLPLGLVERRGRDNVLGLFRSWFGGPDQLELVDATVGEVGPRLYLRWRDALTPLGCPGPRRLIRTLMFLAKEAVRLAVNAVAQDVACAGCPPLPNLVDRYQKAGGSYLVCPICGEAKQIEKNDLLLNAEIGSTVLMWQ